MDRIPLNLGYMWFYDSEKELLSVLVNCMVQPPLFYVLSYANSWIVQNKMLPKYIQGFLIYCLFFVIVNLKQFICCVKFSLATNN